MRCSVPVISKYALFLWFITGSALLLAALTLSRWLFTAPPLAFAHSDADFGTAWQDENVKLHILLTNRSDETIHLEKVAKPCACLSITPSSRLVTPGQACTLDISLVFDGATFERTSALSKQIELPIVLSLRVGKALHTAVIPVKGHVLRSLFVDTPLVDFGELDVGPGTYEASFTCIHGPGIVKVDCNTSALSGVSCEVLQHDTTSSVIQIALSSPVRLGSQRHVVALVPTTSTDTVLTPVPVTVQWFGLADIRVIPRTLVFGEVPLGASRDVQVTAWAKDGSPVSLHGACRSERLDASISQVARNERASVCHCNVHLTATTVGSVTDAISFTLRTERGLREIYVPASYHGIPVPRGKLLALPSVHSTTLHHGDNAITIGDTICTYDGVMH